MECEIFKAITLVCIRQERLPKRAQNFCRLFGLRRRNIK
jgi:hypothetical protein